MGKKATVAGKGILSEGTAASQDGCPGEEGGPYTWIFAPVHPSRQGSSPALMEFCTHRQRLPLQLPQNSCCCIPSLRAALPTCLLPDAVKGSLD